MHLTEGRGLGRYRATLAVLLAAAALLLFAVVEMRRGFLFPLSSYFTIGAPSAILYFDPRQLALLGIGGLAAWLSYRRLVRVERDLIRRGADLVLLTRVVGVALLALLIADLFIYRGVPASRIVAAGKTGVGQAIPLDLFRDWLRPVGEGLNYLALVWHATLLGILIGALFLTLVAGLLRYWLGGSGWRCHLAGAFLAVGHPFCSCCAAPVGATLYRGGASFGSTLAFAVSSPMLNPTTLVLAVALLPVDFAVLRIAGGVGMGILATYLVARVAARWTRERATGGSAPERATALSRLLDAFARQFAFESLLGGKSPDAPGALIATWLSVAWRLGRVVVVVLFLGSVAASAIVMVLPSPANDVPGILAAAALGTLLMIPTWTELPIALTLLRDGLTGPAAALLITLPAVSLPSLLILGAATRSYRGAALLGAVAFGAGSLAGLWFLG